MAGGRVAWLVGELEAAAKRARDADGQVAAEVERRLALICGELQDRYPLIFDDLIQLMQERSKAHEEFTRANQAFVRGNKGKGGLRLESNGESPSPRVPMPDALLALETWTMQRGNRETMVRRREVFPSALTAMFFEDLIEQEQMDYRTHGVIETFLIFPGGLVPLRRALAPEREAP